jgi:hypothetical protein
MGDRTENRRESMARLQYRIGTASFQSESCPTWESRSRQVLAILAAWGRDGWQVSRLNVSGGIRVGARGFCVLLERPFAEENRAPRGLGSRRGRQLSAA